jgi:hypothetical protein
MNVISTLVMRHSDINWSWQCIACYVTEETLINYLKTVDDPDKQIGDMFLYNDYEFILRLSDAFIEKYPIVRSFILQNHALSKFNEYILTNNTEIIIKNRNITLPIIEIYCIIFDSFDWASISVEYLSREFIIKHSERFYWSSLSFNKCLTFDLITLFIDKIDWNNISYNPNITEDFICEYWDRLKDNACVFYNPAFSMRLVDKYYDELNWMRMGLNTNLTPAFIREHWSKLNKHQLSENPNLTPAIIRDFANEWDWSQLILNRALMLEIAEENIWRLK